MHIVETIKRYLGWCPGAGTSRFRKRAAAGTDGLSQTTHWISDKTPPGEGDPGAPWKRRYEHTQVGMLQIYAVLAIMIIVIATTLLAGAFIIAHAVLALLIVAILCFATLTVTVCDDAVRIRFGPIGLITKEFPLDGIAAVTAVKNPWYYGYGIRWTPGGPLYNVAGKDAVEISMWSGKKVRIGTDEPGVLMQEIEQVKTKKIPKHPV